MLQSRAQGAALRTCCAREPGLFPVLWGPGKGKEEQAVGLDKGGNHRITQVWERPLKSNRSPESRGEARKQLYLCIQEEENQGNVLISVTSVQRRGSPQLHCSRSAEAEELDTAEPWPPDPHSGIPLHTSTCPGGCILQAGDAQGRAGIHPGSPYWLPRGAQANKQLSGYLSHLSDRLARAGRSSAAVQE